MVAIVLIALSAVHAAVFLFNITLITLFMTSGTPVTPITSVFYVKKVATHLVFLFVCFPETFLMIEIAFLAEMRRQLDC